MPSTTVSTMPLQALAANRQIPVLRLTPLH
jgi:hypothetical protein